MVESNKKKRAGTALLWTIRAVSVLAAVLIWVMVTITQNPLADKIFMVPLEQRFLPENLILEKSISQVQVRLQGTAAVINDLTPASITAYVDMAGLKAGKYELEIMLELPEHVQVLSRRPDSIEVELKDTISEMFPLEVEPLGEPAPSYKRLEAVVSPAEVKLTGAEDYMRRVSRVYVAASVQDINESFDKNLSVLVEDAAGNDISIRFKIEPKVARLVIPVVFEQPERLVAVRVPISGQPALGYQLSLISATPSMVQVFGDLKRLQALYYVDTEPVDVSDLQADSSRTVRLAPGNGLTVFPREVTVALKIEPGNSATVTKSIILYRNLTPGYLAEVEQHNLAITVYGPETFIAALNEIDIVPYVDCAELEGGEYELPIRVSLPANIELKSISQDTALVTIIAPVVEEAAEDIPPEQGGAEIIDNGR